MSLESHKKQDGVQEHLARFGEDIRKNSQKIYDAIMMSLDEKGLIDLDYGFNRIGGSIKHLAFVEDEAKKAEIAELIGKIAKEEDQNTKFQISIRIQELAD